MAVEEREISANTDSSTSQQPLGENGASSQLSLRARKAQKRVHDAKIEREVVTLRLAGVAYDTIAREIGIPSKEKSDGTAAYRIWQRALKKMSMPNVAEARLVQLRRLEELYFNLQKPKGGMKDGVPRAVEVGLAVLDQEARLVNTYPAPNVNLPSQNVSVTVVDRVEFVALPESAGTKLVDVSSGAASEADQDARGVIGPARSDSGGGGSDGDRQDVVRPDLGVGPSTT